MNFIYNNKQATVLKKFNTLKNHHRDLKAKLIALKDLRSLTSVVCYF